MTLNDKIQLMELLHEYQSEKARQNIKRERDEYGSVIPTKALYTHARVLSTKLAMEIEHELKSTWEA